VTSALPGRIALFPLHTVLFPGGLLPLRVFEQRYVRMTTACMRNDEPFGVCLIRDGAEVGAPAVPHFVGCLARIVQWDMPQLGMLNLVVRGGRRFRALDRQVESDGLAQCAFELLAEEDTAGMSEEHAVYARLLRSIVEEGAGAQVPQPADYESAAWVSGRLVELLPLPLAFKQRLLEMDASAERLEALHQFLRSHRLAPGG
jgi:Lon protease-like protein